MAKQATEKEEELKDQNQDTQDTTSETEAPVDETPTSEREATTEEEQEDPLAEKERELAEAKDKYLRIYSEFENFRRRTAKEKLELIQTATEKLMVDILPVLDDFERAQKSMTDAAEVDAIKEGVELIHTKLYKILEGKGLKPIGAQGEAFDTELHEAVTQIPAPTEDMKGKVVDEIEKGYYLGEKVIRFSKVVIGS